MSCHPNASRVTSWRAPKARSRSGVGPSGRHTAIPLNRTGGATASFWAHNVVQSQVDHHVPGIAPAAEPTERDGQECIVKKRRRFLAERDSRLAYSVPGQGEVRAVVQGL